MRINAKPVAPLLFLMAGEQANAIRSVECGFG